MLTRVLISREYAKLWLAGAVSWIGDYVFDVTVVLWIATAVAPDKPWAVSGVLAAVVIPTLLVGPLAGVFVDRWDNRRTMLVSDALRMVLIGGLAIMPVLPDGALSVGAQLTVIYAVVAVSTAISQFFTPARYTVVADVVEPVDQARASGIGQATMAMAGILGPPLAAPLLFGVGVAWALLANAVSFGLSFVVLLFVRVPGRVRPAQHQGVWLELRAGMRAIGASRVLVAIVVSAMVANFGAYLLNNLNIFFLTHNLGAAPGWYGYMGTAFGIGAVIGAAVAGGIGQRLGLGRTYWIALIMAGVLIAAYSRSTTFIVGLILMLCVALPVAAISTMVAPIIIRSVPRDTLGRVFALLQPAVQIMSVLAIGTAGWLSSSLLKGLDATVAGVRFTTYDSIILFAGVLIAGCGVYAMFALRGADAGGASPDGPTPTADDAPAHGTG
jgi:MFS family permease